jgi:hypothetical protein
VDGFVDAGALGDDEDDDEVRRSVASSMVVVAGRDVQWRRRIAWPEAVGAAAMSRSIPTAWPRVCGERGVRREGRGGGVFIGGSTWARGLGFGRGASDQTASGEAVAEPVSWRRRLIGGSHLSASYALRWHTASASGACWAGPGFLAWAESVPLGLFYFPLIFSFLFFSV